MAAGRSCGRFYTCICSGQRSASARAWRHPHCMLWHHQLQRYHSDWADNTCLCCFSDVCDECSWCVFFWKCALMVYLSGSMLFLLLIFTFSSKYCKTNMLQRSHTCSRFIQLPWRRLWTGGLVEEWWRTPDPHVMCLCPMVPPVPRSIWAASLSVQFNEITDYFQIFNHCRFWWTVF